MPTKRSGKNGRRPAAFVVEAIQRSNRTQKLFMQVAEALAHQIVNFASSPIGLPPEPELRRMLGVSRTVLREAVKVLEAKGMVEVGHGRGVVTRPFKEWHHLDPEVMYWRGKYGADERFLEELIEVREILESAAAALARERADRAGLERLKICRREMENAAAVSDSPAYLAADSAFYREISQRCGNDILVRMSRSVREAIAAAGKMPAQSSGGRTVLPAHVSLREAVREHKGAVARDTVTATAEEETRRTN